MNTKSIFLAMICLMNILNASAFTQMRNWVVLPNKVQMIWGSNPSVSAITGASSSQYACANGVFDNDNNLLFYVRDGVIYNSSSSSIGTLASNPLKEVVITPVPGECKKYYVIVARAIPLVEIELYYTIVNANTGTISMTTPVKFASLVGNACGLAASKIISGSGSSSIRYLYSITYNKFSRFTISSSGIGSLTDLTPSGLPSGGASAFLPVEAELNHAGTRFAWANCSYGPNDGKVYEITTSGTPTLYTYTLPAQGSGCTVSNQGISGLEYDASGNLWVSATSSCSANKGIYKITTTSTPSYLYMGSSTQSFDFTQLELSNYGLILGVNNSGSFGYIDPSNNTFSTTTYTISFTVVSNGSTPTLPGVYSLPDQIDGESYYDFVGVPSVTADFKINNQTPVTNCGSIQQVYNCNPIAFSNLSSGATSYTLEVNSVDASCNLNGTYNYNSGSITTLPTDLRSMPGTGGTYLASNTGRFRVRLTATNGCLTSEKVALIQVNGAPTAVTSCFTFANNTTCSGSGVSGSASCSSPTTVCSNNPKIKADCSGGQFVQGSFDIVIDEYNSSCGFIQNVGNSLNNPLTSTADLVCLSLNDFTTTPGYFYSNPTGRRYKVTLTIRNVCSSHPSFAWFTDNLGGCKTGWDDEEQLTTGIDDDDTPKFHTSVFPNPTTSNTTLQLGLTASSEVSAYVYNLQGSMIIPVVINQNFTTGNHNVEIPSDRLAAGVYVYNVVINGQSYKGKFIKAD